VGVTILGDDRSIGVEVIAVGADLVRVAGLLDVALGGGVQLHLDRWLPPMNYGID
jgi:hypothetical protein